MGTCSICTHACSLTSAAYFTASKDSGVMCDRGSGTTIASPRTIFKKCGVIDVAVQLRRWICGSMSRQEAQTRLWLEA
jgi:hypothetical protein